MINILVKPNTPPNALNQVITRSASNENGYIQKKANKKAEIPSVNKSSPIARFFRLSSFPALNTKMDREITKIPVIAPIKATEWLMAKIPLGPNSKFEKTRR